MSPEGLEQEGPALTHSLPSTQGKRKQNLFSHGFTGLVGSCRPLWQTEALCLQLLDQNACYLICCRAGLTLAPGALTQGEACARQGSEDPLLAEAALCLVKQTLSSGASSGNHPQGQHLESAYCSGHCSGSTCSTPGK